MKRIVSRTENIIHINEVDPTKQIVGYWNDVFRRAEKVETKEYMNTCIKCFDVYVFNSLEEFEKWADRN